VRTELSHVVSSSGRRYWKWASWKAMYSGSRRGQMEGWIGWWIRRDIVFLLFLLLLLIVMV
jgi:uncharacterized membrane protein